MGEPKLFALGSVSVEWSDDLVAGHYHHWTGATGTPEGERVCCECGAKCPSDGYLDFPAPTPC